MDNHFLERCLNLGPFLEKMNVGKKLAFCFHVFFLIHLLPQGILTLQIRSYIHEENGIKIGRHTIFRLSR